MFAFHPRTHTFFSEVISNLTADDLALRNGELDHISFSQLEPSRQRQLDQVPYSRRRPEAYQVRDGWSKEKLLQVLGVPDHRFRAAYKGDGEEWEYLYVQWRGSFLVNFDQKGIVVRTAHALG